MKFKLPIGVCILITLVLVSFGLLYGTVNGYREERAQVTSFLEGENSLWDAMRYRGADGLNLCVVARRHLKDDPAVEELMSAANALHMDGDSIVVKMQQNERVEKAAQAVAEALKQSESFNASERDIKYLDMLTANMQDLSKSVNIDYYNEKAREFNNELETKLLGKFAGMLGVKPCELFE